MKRRAGQTGGFVNGLARLLKLWVSFLHSPGDPDFKKGCSFRMELIANEAAKGSNDDMRNGFERALILIRDFREMYVTDSPFYDEECIPQNLRNQRPLLINPSDPHENLLDKKVHMYMCTHTHTHTHTHTSTCSGESARESESESERKSKMIEGEGVSEGVSGYSCKCVLIMRVCVCVCVCVCFAR